MKLVRQQHVSAAEKNFIFRVWNMEYPQLLAFNAPGDVDTYLAGLKDPTHIVAVDNEGTLQAWAAVFEREGEKWFTLIIAGSSQRKGLGTLMIQALKETDPVLNGWVIDHANGIRANGDYYASPLPFYLKNKFNVCSNIRLETDKLSAVKITWSSEQND